MGGKEREKRKKRRRERRCKGGRKRAGVVWGREDPEGFIGEELASADLGSAQEGMVVSVCRCWALPQVVCIRQVASVSSRQCLCSAAESQQVAWCVME